MSRPGRNSATPPARHMALGHGARTLWMKMRWEANNIKAAHDARPVDAISLMFTAINFAITAKSLEDWLVKELRDRQGRKAFDGGAIRDEVAKAVPMQAAFRDIANTAKHGEYRDENWIGGTVEFVSMPGLAGTEREYVLIYHGDDGAARTSLTMFEEATQQWMRLMLRKGLLFPDLQDSRLASG